MFNIRPVPSANWFRAKYIAFAFIGIMTAYVIFHNERFLIDSAHPVWLHYETFKWWLLPHGVVGACVLLLAPMQFSDRLRKRFTTLHRIVGRIYVGGILIMAPLGAYINYLNEPLGAPRSLTVAAIVDALVLMSTTGMGLYFALQRMIPQHRQWMTRSYGVALVFLEVRVILGVTGWDTPPNPEITETVVWTCLAFSLLIGDLANQMYDLQPARKRSATAQAAQAGDARAAA